MNYRHIVLLLLALVLATPAARAREKTVRIGIQAENSLTSPRSAWQATAHLLNTTMPGHHFVIVPLVGVAAVLQSVGNHELDFILTSPALAAEIELGFDSIRLATLVKQHQGKSCSQLGSVIFTRADDSAIASLPDLRNRTLVALSREAFAGWQVTWKELQNHGIRPFTDLKQVHFVGGADQDVVYAVRDRLADAGTVRTGVLERMVAGGQIRITDFRIVNEQRAADFPFLLSTTLYPEWAFSRLPWTDPVLSEQLVIALLQIRHNSIAARTDGYYGWTTPADDYLVHDALADLGIEPFNHKKREVSLRDVITQFEPWVLLTLSLVVVLASLAAWTLRINVRMHQAQRELAASNDQLRQRVRELNMMYTVSSILERDISMAEKLDHIASALPDAFPQPDGTGARIRYKRSDYMTGNFRYGKHCLVAPIVVDGGHSGTVEACAEDGSIVSADDEAAFARQDNLLKEVATRINQYLERMDALETLRRGKLVLEEQVEARTRQLELARDQAEQASHAKSEFLSRMSHELRTPLNAILGFAQLMESDSTNPLGADQQENLAEVLNAGYHLLELISEILDLARIEQGGMALKMEAVALGDVIDECIALVQPQARERGIHIMLRLPDTLCAVAADHTRLKQILLNLLSNAVKYNHRNGSIQVYCDAIEHDTVKISVQDSGSGISQEQQQKLFQPFERLDQEHRVPGTGIGLAVCQRLTALMGGRIGVDSAPDEGSCFWFTLRCAGHTTLTTGQA